MTINGRHLLHGLKSVLVVCRVTVIYEEPSEAIRFPCADIGRFENRAQCSLSGRRMPFHKVLVGRDHAAEVVRPRTIDDAVENEVTNVLVPQFLWVRRKTKESVDLALAKESYCLSLRMHNPFDVFRGVPADMGQYSGKENVVACYQLLYRY